MKIIVTGCKGQLGTEIIKQLREGRSEIGPIPEKLMNATVIPVDLPELDISNYKMVDDFIRRQRPDGQKSRCRTAENCLPGRYGDGQAGGAQGQIREAARPL